MLHHLDRAYKPLPVPSHGLRELEQEPGEFFRSAEGDPQFARLEVDPIRKISQVPRGRAGGQGDAAGSQAAAGAVELVTTPGNGGITSRWNGRPMQ